MFIIIITHHDKKETANHFFKKVTIVTQLIVIVMDFDNLYVYNSNNIRELRFSFLLFILFL